MTKSITSVNVTNHVTRDLNTPKTTTADDTCADPQSTAYSESYFDALYSDNTDPWQYQTRWYEKRKRDICLAVLPQARYHNAIELGSGNGVFSELLAHRCQHLVSIDGNHQAVQLARQRLAALSHTTVIQGIIPTVLSTIKNESFFDLIIISEILYYLSPEDIDTVIAWVQQHLAKGGTLLCCHWRYPIDGFVMTGETVHQRLNHAFNLTNHIQKTEDKAHHQVTLNHQSQMIDSDFLLDVWQRASHSIAQQENLI